MKKILIAFIIFCSASFVFARPVFQLDLVGNGLLTDYDYSAFSGTSEYFNNEYYPLLGFSGLFLWEFNSSSDSNFHFYAGFEAGFLGLGVPASLAGGFSYKLKKAGPVVMELNTTFQAGVYTSILDGNSTGFGKINADVVVMKSSRRGIYGGIGITENILPLLDYYVDYGWTASISNFLGCRLVAGIRF